MDSYNNGNTNTNNKSHPTKSRNFSQAAVNKSDVGDFQAGYFVMADPMPQHKPKTNKTLERHPSEKRNQRPPQQTVHRARSTNDMDTSSPRESDINVSHGRLPTSPHRSPNRNKRNSHSPPQPQYSSQSDFSSPQKPLKAHVERECGSPIKEKRTSTSPPNRWAGPAFSNAPPPSSLPIPDFPPFAPNSPSISPSSSPPPPSSPPLQSSAPTNMFLTPVPIQEPQFFAQPPMYAYRPHPLAYQAHHHLAYADYSYSSQGGSNSLAQLSTDLRRMLNIAEQPQPVRA